jgi:rSAM/selenodomain-associated transferase 1
VEDLLIVFTKAPIAGMVKTRMFPHVSFEEAAKLQHAFLADTLAKGFAQPGVKVCLAYTPPEALEMLEASFGKENLLYLAQEGADLGERMSRAFDAGFGMGCGRVLIVGSDVPTLPEQFIQAAFDGLKDADVVIGPAKDGGYYLIGMKEPNPAMFEGITWSGPKVFGMTLKRAEWLKLKVFELPELQDVDSFTDLKLLLDEPLPPNTGRRVRELLSRLTEQPGWVE